MPSIINKPDLSFLANKILNTGGCNNAVSTLNVFKNYVDPAHPPNLVLTLKLEIIVVFGVFKFV